MSVPWCGYSCAMRVRVLWRRGDHPRGRDLNATWDVIITQIIIFQCRFFALLIVPTSRVTGALPPSTSFHLHRVLLYLPVKRTTKVCQDNQGTFQFCMRMVGTHARTRKTNGYKTKQHYLFSTNKIRLIELSWFSRNSNSSN